MNSTRKRNFYVPQLDQLESRRLLTVGDLVWHDLDGDGLQGSSEPGISDVTVRLLDETGNLLETDQTNANGRYSLVPPMPGNYQLEFVAPTDFVFTQQGTSAENDSDVDPSTARTAVFAFLVGDVNPHLDAGLFQLGNIEGNVFFDANQNQTQDVDELNLPQVTIYLDANDNSRFDVGELTTVTNANGQYRFDQLPPGEHVVRQQIPTGWDQSFPAVSRDRTYVASAYQGGGLRLATINGTSGEVQFSGGQFGQAVHGLIVMNSGRILGMNGQADSLFEIDPATGAHTWIGDTGLSMAWGLAHDSRTDTIYSVAREPGGAGHQLFIIDPSDASSTAIGDTITGLTGTSGMAIDEANNRLIAFDNADDEYYEFHLDGTVSRLATASPSLNTWSMSFDGVGLVQQAVNVEGNTVLVRIDPDTGQWGSAALVMQRGVAMEGLDYYEIINGGEHRVQLASAETSGGNTFGDVSLLSDLQPPQLLDIAVNTQQVDLPDIGDAPQPTAWQTQRSDIRDIRLRFNERVRIATSDLVLRNLGTDVSAGNTQVIPLDDSQITVNGNDVIIHFEHQELPAGVYQLEALDTLTDWHGNPLDGDLDGAPGGAFAWEGNAENRFYRLPADFNGDGAVSVFDFPVLSYFFGEFTAPMGPAPQYADLNADHGISIFDLPEFIERFQDQVFFRPASKNNRADTAAVSVVHAASEQLLQTLASQRIISRPNWRSPLAP